MGGEGANRSGIIFVATQLALSSIANPNEPSFIIIHQREHPAKPHLFPALEPINCANLQQRARGGVRPQLTEPSYLQRAMTLCYKFGREIAESYHEQTFTLVKPSQSFRPPCFPSPPNLCSLGLVAIYPKCHPSGRAVAFFAHDLSSANRRLLSKLRQPAAHLGIVRCDDSYVLQPHARP